ncbi:MAG: hypothetical protein A2W52_01410 [Candidatus Taylorbacteria bacterium RIFCSPHIGHO2_02_49_25]|uniref:Uncharacterized protein n=1 Tax=Candidatus Taylorbacteria bacterium RIFCSPHIGHO2_02_49_25 TaxID=1802305 RepID=A0A1G2MDJ0_9BACT|nr:MAG: hypothetical protein UY62_C0018G0005 [Parcubacteria group bacterium GW2011_GWF2_50_9]OHA21328.1 MAG: hypothetical protein A2759_02385 [Candidatus Taylorbacteria bacterium RIFCSPHIGHO2_01_FULL_49_60]OHA21957.1 MAG: hypothetical protein A2W52_01410 [Candidatus Taylorbacteria bacterium RIFCSPHIGHO2_02_49_25]OHA36892.1 MAG: hypothetical protein A3B27_02895 [Candidatus Taylorbacteria bacterium RIFCSPLOWO2_01_FULL_50_130]OHA37605.1 MAG: hypothetical protein A2W65_02135 [Candidatus Taylorbacte
MISTTVFAVSFLGLLALLGCKILELNRGVQTPLTRFRSAVDPLLARCLAYCRLNVRMAVSAGFHASLRSVRTSSIKIRTVFDATMHTVAARLNRYLRTRRLHLRHGNEVSAHLKTVLEKEDKNNKRPTAP